MQQFAPQQRKPFIHQYEVGIVANVAGCGAEVQDGARQRALDPVRMHVCHHIVAHFFFDPFRFRKIDLLRVDPHFGDLFRTDGKTQFHLAFRQGDP